MSPSKKHFWRRLRGGIALGLIPALLATPARAGNPDFPYPPPVAPYQPQILPPPPPPTLYKPLPPTKYEPSPSPALRAPSGGGGGGATYFPGGMTMTATKILHEDRDKDAARSNAVIGRPRQAVDHLATCWSPPLPPKGETVEITIKFSFNSRGEVSGTPRTTYVKASGSSRDAVRASILDAIKTCSPLNFSKSMAASAAGYPITVRFIGRRADD
ncbi:hypothetical protein GJ654_06425 [Rhodoblastus acidophilus]|uniref:TonB C-terminal domain-containing protein n=1 Tax=Rhodoblastus acidophilus TaxID=1074 RepID=A0A6N8DJT1_RHOAC|nr:hypothetical protein [Rhodoblastus acidophilus]MCW2274054.1 hypothetical protein [Rhodoblastus acidophilus]MTV30627.1 hypothetical protein [Rhodoblastus acidophilus]